MNFKFRLEGILKLRKEQERDAQYELGRLRQEEYAIHQVLVMVAEEGEKWRSTYTDESRNENTGNYLMMIEQYFKNLDQVKKRNLQLLADLQKQIDKTLIKVKETYKARKQVEYLKEKQYEEFKKEADRKEQLMYSEMSTIQFVNRTMEENYEKNVS